MTARDRGQHRNFAVIIIDMDFSCWSGDDTDNIQGRTNGPDGDSGRDQSRSQDGFVVGPQVKIIIPCLSG